MFVSFLCVILISKHVRAAPLFYTEMCKLYIYIYIHSLHISVIMVPNFVYKRKYIHYSSVAVNERAVVLIIYKAILEYYYIILKL